MEKGQICPPQLTRQNLFLSNSLWKWIEEMKIRIMCQLPAHPLIPKYNQHLAAYLISCLLLHETAGFTLFPQHIQVNEKGMTVRAISLFVLFIETTSFLPPGKQIPKEHPPPPSSPSPCPPPLPLTYTHTVHINQLVTACLGADSCNCFRL